MKQTIISQIDLSKIKINVPNGTLPKFIEIQNGRHKPREVKE